jgi:Acyclic terpene utilisation family protein AtuA
MDEIRFVAATGAVGAGIHAASLAAATEHGLSFIAADAGTTDAGPAALGSGEPAFARDAVRADLKILIAAGRRAGIPVIIGSAGTAGADAHVDWVLDLVRDISAELDLDLRVAVVRTQQDPEYLVKLLEEGRLRPLHPAPALDATTIRRSTRIVGMMGAEPIQAALDLGVDLVIGGRASDSALYAAMPLSRGFPPGLSWHVGKIIECGTLACERSGKGVVMATLRPDHAVITPIGRGLRCTPQSVAAHTLYENADPYLFYESSGTLDLSQAVFEAETDTSVRISGSLFRPASEYTVKLEGAELAGYSTVMIGGIRDPFILARLDSWLEGVMDRFRSKVKTILGLDPDAYRAAVHCYGRDGVMGVLEPERSITPHEVGIVFEVLASSQSLATELAKIARQPFLHFRVPEWKGAITTIAYLHNPPQIERGAVYRFNINHVALPHSPLEMFRIETIDLKSRAGAPNKVGVA